MRVGSGSPGGLNVRDRGAAQGAILSFNNTKRDWDRLA